MTTPWGTPVQTFANRTDFYAEYPDRKIGWKDSRRNQNDAPYGGDLDHRDNVQLIFCAPDPSPAHYSGSGTLVAFDYNTGTVNVLAASISYEEAQARAKAAGHAQD